MIQEYKKWLLLYLLMAVVSTQVNATVRLPAIFSDHMVLQQQTAVAVWGWAKPGEEVVVSGSWSGKKVLTTTGKDGKWILFLRTPVAGGPYTVNIKGENNIQLTDVLVGEVWIASGQSNMATSLKPSFKGEEEVAKADHPRIRHFSVKRQYGLKDFDDAPGTQWIRISPSTAGSFSAVAYYFAKNLQDSLKVPVGIIYNAWGGTPAQAWMPHDLLQNDTKLSVYLDRWKKILHDAGKDSVTYNNALQQWAKQRVDSTKDGWPKMPAEPQSVYYFKRPWREPGVLFNGMLKPVVPYSIKGVVWYQGESNVADADEYEYLLTRMIDSWRNAWKRKGGAPGFSFYIVQIAANGYNDLDAAARVRAAQQNVADKVKHSGIAITMDLGEMDNIHYAHKREAGERLAWLALAKDYNRKQIVYAGPRCKKVTIEANKAVVHFDQPIETIEEKAGDGFEIGYKKAGADSVMYLKAEVKIEGNKALLWNDKIAKPLMVRYAWLLPDEANIMNSKGLPAHPFSMKVQQ
jgi:sialate O-acetylesterase